MANIKLKHDADGRSQKWDIVKFVMIFFVVLGHAADYYTGESEIMRGFYIFIYSFHMPVFFFVSGLFSKRTVDEKRKEKVFGFIVMYVFMKAVILVTQLLAGKSPKFELFSEGGFPWYLLAMAFFLVITMLIKDFSPAYVLVFSVLLACFAGYDSSIGNFLSLSRVIVFYPFFYLGYALDRKKVEKFCSGKIKKLLSAALIIGLIIFVVYKCDDIYWVRLLLTGRNSFLSLAPNTEKGFFFRLTYYAAVTIISCAVIILIPNKTPFGFAARLGQRTLSVYVFHYVVFYCVYNVFECKNIFAEWFPQGSEWVVIPLSIITTLVLSSKFLNDFLLKIMNVPLKKLKK